MASISNSEWPVGAVSITTKALRASLTGEEFTFEGSGYTALGNRIEVSVLGASLPEPKTPAPSDVPEEELPDTADYTYRESPRTLPSALKVMQYKSATATETVSTVFRLQRHYQCWWIRF